MRMGNSQLNLSESSKCCATQGCLRRNMVNKKKLNDSQQINDALYNLYQRKTIHIGRVHTEFS